MLSTANWEILGVLRFALALVVVCSHLTWFTPDSIMTSISKLSGLAAVIGFLIISGYSIAHSIETRPDGFYTRRVFRIIPTYFFAVILSYFLGRYGLTHSGQFPAADIKTLFENLFFIQVFTGKSLPSNAVIWTLSVEVCLYIIAPLLHRLSLWFVLGLAIVSACSFSIYLRATLPFFNVVGGGLNLVLMGWAWLLGFWYYSSGPRLSKKVVLFALPTLALGTANGTYLTPLWPLTIATVVIALMIHRPPFLPPLQRACYLAGDISYPLYLVHLPVMIVVDSYYPKASGIMICGLAVASSLAVFLCIDWPLRFRHTRRPVPILAPH